MIFPEMKRILGLDWGEKRLGLALSDALLMTAGPAGHLERKGLEQDMAALVKYIDENEVGEIVIGMPLDQYGEKGVSAEKVENFAKELRGRLGLPVHLWDERMSTSAVEKMLIEADVSRGKRRKVRDGLSAAYILQGFLDARSEGKTSHE